MNFITKGEFIQALKDYDDIKRLHYKVKTLYDRAYYQRYEKIKSPLDYEVVGYDSNGESIRQIKGRGSVSQEQITEKNEILDKKIEDYEKKLKAYESLMKKTNDELYLIDQPLNSILVERYKKHKTLKNVCNKFRELCLDESGMYKYIMRELDKYYAPTE